MVGGTEIPGTADPPFSGQAEPSFWGKKNPDRNAGRLTLRYLPIKTGGSCFKSASVLPPINSFLIISIILS